MEKISNFYNSKSPRERAMFAAVLWIVAFLWMSSIASSVSSAREQAEALSSKISVAESVVGQGDKIRRALERVRASFDAGKTVSASDLQLNVEKCAADAGLDYALSTTSTKDAKDYKINSLSLNCRNSDLAALAKFEELIEKFEPYLYVDKVSFDAGSKALNAKYVIVSINM